MSNLFVQEEDSDEELLQLELSRQEELSAINQHPNVEQLEDNISITLPSKGVLLGNDELEINNLEEDSDDDIQLYPLIPVDSDKNNDLKPDIQDIRPVDIQLSVTLPFQQQIIQNCLMSDDPLVIMGQGLGVTNVVANLLHVLATPTRINGEAKRSLVVLLNASSNDNRQIDEELQELAWLDEPTDLLTSTERPFNIVTSDSLSVEKRRQLYLTGGIVSVTSRILIVDLLSGILHPNKITGMVVLNVDSLKNNSNESFILEIYRSQNNWGFIKGFSENPGPFIMEFSPLLRRKRELRFKNVLLWPRFRVEISSILNKVSESNKVIEVKVSQTNSMSQIQFGLIECLNKCIGELNRKNPTLRLEWWTLEHALDVNFLKSIDAVMMPNWHRISFESKQLIKDIRFLKNLLKLLVDADAVDFYEEVQTSLDANKPSISRKYTESPWLMAEESQLVISYARKRVYFNEEYSLEEMPKWEQLSNILEDIAQERLEKTLPGPTLIVCSSDKTIAQLSRLVNMGNRKHGLRQLMLKKLEYYKEMREERKKMLNEVKDKEIQENELNVSTTFSKNEVMSKRRRTRGASVVAAVQRMKTSGAGEDIEGAIDSYNMESELHRIQHDDTSEPEESDPEIEEKLLNHFENIPDYIDFKDEEPTIKFGDDILELQPKITKEIWEKRVDDLTFVESSEQIIIEKFSSIDDESLLQEFKPSFIVIFEPDLTFIRRVEIYRAVQQNNLKIYFMYYAESVEEQSHLTAIKREKDTFSKLIKENAQMAHHFETPEDISHFKNLAERKIKMNKLNKRNTRNAGAQKNNQHFTQDIVIVDTREFNASLPGLLFRYGVRVVPVMLAVGDYVISPDICLERKSISDLIASFQNNRLVNQCKKMLRYYKFATLLIEFDEGQSFSLEPFSERKNYRKANLSTTHPISSKLSQDEIQSKLAKLVMRFPGLKIIWSSSPLQSVNIILELKLGREQPDPTTVASYGTHLRKNHRANSDDLKQKTEAERFSKLLGIEGLSKIDYFNIRRKIKSYDKLMKMNIDQLLDLTGASELAYRILNFIQEQKDLEDDIDIEDI